MLLLLLLLLPFSSFSFLLSSESLSSSPAAAPAAPRQLHGPLNDLKEDILIPLKNPVFTQNLRLWIGFLPCLVLLLAFAGQLLVKKPQSTPNDRDSPHVGASQLKKEYIIVLPPAWMSGFCFGLEGWKDWCVCVCDVDFGFPICGYKENPTTTTVGLVKNQRGL